MGRGSAEGAAAPLKRQKNAPLWYDTKVARHFVFLGAVRRRRRRTAPAK